MHFHNNTCFGALEIIKKAFHIQPSKYRHCLPLCSLSPPPSHHNLTIHKHARIFCPKCAQTATINSEKHLRAIYAFVRTCSCIQPSRCTKCVLNQSINAFGLAKKSQREQKHLFICCFAAVWYGKHKQNVAMPFYRAR